MSSDHQRGLDAGMRGSVIGPTSAEGVAGFMAGQAIAANRGKMEGSAEWVIAPVVLAPFFAIFYPVTTAATLATAFAAEGLANAVGLGNSALRWALILVPTIAVCWTVGRMDQQWGLKSRTYYIVRHVARMISFALLANGAAHNAAATAANRSAMDAIPAMFSTPVAIVPVLLMVVFWQVFFIRAYSFRIYWNRKLMSWRFRPKDFPPFYFQWRKTPAPYAPAEPIPMPGRWSSRPSNE
jgi:hypothetical protein